MKTKTKKLSPAMERLVGAMSNQAIWGNRRAIGMKEKAEVQKSINECEANLNRLNGEIMGTVNGIIDSNPKANADEILEEAGLIVDANQKAKQDNQPKLPVK